MGGVDAVSRMAEALGLARLAAARGPILVMYHGLGGEDGISAGAFGDQLDWLASAFQVVSLEEAIAALGSAAAANRVAITFDDGYRDFAEIAVPALRSRGLHATVFVPGAHIGGHNVWDEGFAAKRHIMDRAELRDLDSAVVEVGVHGMEHRRLAGLSENDLVRETADAKQEVEQALGRSTRYFAYPYGQLGDFDAAAERAVEAAGFEAACSTHFGRGSKIGERYRLRRVGIGPGDDLDLVARKLGGAYDWTAGKERVGWWLRRAGLRR